MMGVMVFVEVKGRLGKGFTKLQHALISNDFPSRVSLLNIEIERKILLKLSEQRT